MLNRERRIRWRRPVLKAFLIWSCLFVVAWTLVAFWITRHALTPGALLVILGFSAQTVTIVLGCSMAIVGNDDLVGELEQLENLLAGRDGVEHHERDGEA